MVPILCDHCSVERVILTWISMDIFWSDKLSIPNKEAFEEFIQRMANRIMQGHCRYGAPDKRKKYMTRMEIEVKAYHRTGNAEHLYNIANYAHLECYAPEHKRFHFNSAAKSATRGKV